MAGHCLTLDKLSPAPAHCWRVDIRGRDGVEAKGGAAKGPLRQKPPFSLDCFGRDLAESGLSALEREAGETDAPFSEEMRTTSWRRG